MRKLAPFLLILLLVAALLQIDFYFTIVYFLVALALLGRLWMRELTNAVALERRFEPRAFLGEKIVVTLDLTNRSRLPMPWLSIYESLPVELKSPPFHREVVTLGPHERRTITYTLYCRRRGYYPLGPLRLETGDLLGLLGNQVASQPAGASLTVFPRIVPIQRLGLPTRSPFARLATPRILFEDPSRVVGVRPYRRSDSPRRIHWSASASAGSLLVKQYQHATARETLLFLDLRDESYPRGDRYRATEMAITTAASLANHIIVSEEQPVGLAFVARDPARDTLVESALPVRPERAHLIAMLEILARLVPTEATPPLGARLRRECSRLAWGATLVLITGRLDEATLPALLQIRRQGFAVVALAVQEAILAHAERARAREAGIALHRIWFDEDVERLG